MLELSDDQIREMLRLMDKDSPAHEALTLEVDIQQTSKKLEKMRLEHELDVRALRRAEDEYDEGSNRIIDEMFAVDNEIVKLQKDLDDIIPASVFPRYVFTGDPDENEYDPALARDYIETLKEDFPDDYPKLREASNKLEQLYLREKQLKHEFQQLHEDANLYLPTDLNHPLENAVAAAVHKVTRSNKSLVEVDKYLRGLVAQRAAVSGRAEPVPRSSTTDAGDGLMHWTAIDMSAGMSPAEKVVKDTENEMDELAQQRAVNAALMKRLEQRGKTRATYIKYHKNRTAELRKLGGDPAYHLGKQMLNHTHGLGELQGSTYKLLTKAKHTRQMLAFRSGLIVKRPREYVQFTVIDRLSEEGNTIEVLFLKNQRVAEITIEVDPKDKNNKWVISTCKSIDPAFPQFENVTPGVPSGLSQRLDAEQEVDEGVDKLARYNGMVLQFMKQNSDDATS